MSFSSRKKLREERNPEQMAEEKFGEDRGAFEKKDGIAMFLSAMLTLWLPVLLILLALAGLMFLLL